MNKREVVKTSSGGVLIQAVLILGLVALCIIISAVSTKGTFEKIPLALTGTCCFIWVTALGICAFRLVKAYEQQLEPINQNTLTGSEKPRTRMTLF